MRIVYLAHSWVLFQNEILREKTEAVDHSSHQEEDEEGMSAHEKSQSRGDEPEVTDVPNWEAEIPQSRNEVSIITMFHPHYFAFIHALCYNLC